MCLSNNKLVGPESDPENELWKVKLLKVYENKQIQCNPSALCSTASMKAKWTLICKICFR